MKRYRFLLLFVDYFELLFFVCILVTTSFCFAQDNTFLHYGLEDGLSQGSVRVILKDSKGFLWLGTQDGLNRFDGNTFTVYKSDIENKTSISGNYINELLEDEDHIWVGTSNNGVSCYDQRLNNFRSAGIKNGNCTALSKDDDGNIYATYMTNGLSMFSIHNDSLLERKYDFFKSNNLILTSSTIGKDQNLYVGTKNGRLFYAKLSDKSLQFKEIVFKKNLNEISKIFVEDDAIWLSTIMGLYYYKINENRITAVDIEAFSPNSTEKLTVNTITKKENTYYVATDNGLFVLSQFDKKQVSFQECTIFKGDKNNKNSITSNRVYDLHFDDKLLWIGTNKLDALSLENPVFRTINSSSSIAINNNHVFAIYKTNDYLFVGTRDGLNCIDADGRVTLITKENTNNKLSYNVIRSITKDADNNLWLATTKGVSVIAMEDFNPKDSKIKTIQYVANDSTSLSSNNTRNVFVDHKNQVWVSTFGGGINRFTGNLNSNTFTFQRFVNHAGTNSLSSDLTHSITQDIDHNYWIATKKGLNKLQFKNNNFETPVFTTYLQNSNNLKTPISSDVLTSFHDRENVLWVGTVDGLFRFNKNADNFTYFGQKEGLTNSVVYSILEDNDKALWLSTNSGLFHFDTENETFVNYTVNDGLQSSEFNLGAHFSDEASNQLYFGGINGVNFFDPDDIHKLYNEGNLRFTSLKVKNNEINPDSRDNIIDQNITDATNVYLKHDAFPSHLTFSDLNFQNPNNSQFVYKLIPNDDDWNELYDRKEIQLLNLSAGNYTLQVQGITTHKLWQKEPLEIQLHVSPPWYSSNLAYAVYLISILGLVLLINRSILQRRYQLREVIRLKELNDLKTKLYTNITHEFRTPITVILGMAQSLKDKLQKSPIKSDDQLEMIERNSNNLLDLVNQMLDLSKLEKGKLSLNLKGDDIIVHLKYLTESFLSMAEEKQITLVFHKEISKIIMDFDADKITQILTNLISNAIKFCDKNDKIIVHVSKRTKKDSSQLHIKIKDTGIGIAKESLPYIFDRFYQVENGPTETRTGTGIGLALTKELVLLMNGKISAKSKTNLGTTITVKLPITLKAEKSEATQPGIISKALPTGIAITENLNLESQLPIVLVVEDNKDVAAYIKLCLEGKYQTIYAQNGEKGIEMARELIPDIVISDIMMPKKSGYELCQTLKQDIKTNHIPIILLTAKASQEDKLSGLSCGADAYLTKPFHKEELLIRTEKLIAVRITLQHKYQNAAAWQIFPDKKPENAPDKNDEFINKIIEQINDNMDNSNFHTEQLAKSLHLSESQLYRKLKALTNTSTAIFIRRVRLQKAKQLISSSNISVSEAAYATGFNDPSWFSKSFKNEFGYSPSEKQ